MNAHEKLVVNRMRVKEALEAVLSRLVVALETLPDLEELDVWCGDGMHQGAILRGTIKASVDRAQAMTESVYDVQDVLDLGEHEADPGE